MRQEMIVYCDESGNTGPNYLDPAQPFYTVGGWIVPYAKLADVSAAVELHRQKFSPQAEELHAASALRRKKGLQRSLRLVKSMGELGCIPLFVLCEKRFCLSARIVETFMDPPSNPCLTDFFTHDTTSKRQIADKLYGHVPDQILSDFAAIFQDPTRPALESCLNAIVGCVRKKINAELAKLLEGSRPYLEEIARLEQDSTFPGRVADSVNLTALASVFMMIEHLGRQGAILLRKIVHDETHSFQEAYTKLFGALKKGILRKDRNFALELPNGATVFTLLERIPAFEVGSSAQTPLIQAADMLVGTINFLAKKIMKQETLTKDEEEFVRLVIALILLELPKIAWPVISDRFCLCLGRVLHQGQPRPPKHLSDREILPVLQKHAPAESSVDKEPKYAPDLPLFALVGQRSHGLMIATGVADSDSGAIPGGSAVLLFSSEKNAEDLLRRWEQVGLLSEDQCVRRFSALPEHIRELVVSLEEGLQHTSTILFDYGSNSCVAGDLKEFMSGLRGIMDWLQRAVASGIHEQLIQYHDVEGVRYFSCLLSNGTYAAARVPDGRIFMASTREKALQSAVSGSGSKNAQ